MRRKDADEGIARRSSYVDVGRDCDLRTTHALRGQHNTLLLIKSESIIMKRHACIIICFQLHWIAA